jgi:hypothetical protein
MTGDIARPAQLILKLFIVPFSLFERHQNLFPELVMT